MTLTRELTIKLHRRLWRWVAKETRRQKRIVKKWEYPLFLKEYKYVKCDCWACEYTDQNCDYCPIKWKEGFCFFTGSEFLEWSRSKTWEEAAKWAEIIANLPEKEEK